MYRRQHLHVAKAASSYMGRRQVHVGKVASSHHVYPSRWRYGRQYLYAGKAASVCTKAGIKSSRGYLREGSEGSIFISCCKTPPDQADAYTSKTANRDSHGLEMRVLPTNCLQRLGAQSCRCEAGYDTAADYLKLIEHIYGCGVGLDVHRTTGDHCSYLIQRTFVFQSHTRET